ncbi:aminotransferase class IV [Microcella frigidaquae]|uniref:Branched-subunit amino acid aminotransferase/4-amino-4-deoxychorismate lyase n=1 Tax=Microcella frigidaquae TaxID=424758 RepID=A0A840XKE9_9MICO|nr:aminotransferase class IV [Microcella frigidaquae]MBB5618962.1 branched-subunit amino acid aminotransferase/4-amino-4-deoxychorismate lyase [Microcella frigidaquae]NHN44886.1 aminotransferase class IV [Microcella frigidaquae]
MSDEAAGLHAWTSTGWRTVDWCDPHEGRMLVADSWRVREGRVRGLEQHRARFLGAVADRHPDAEAAVDAALALIPRTGDWFPRIELRERATGPDAGQAGTALALRLRPTPPTRSTAVLATAPHDPRRHPLVKGPDLDALQRLRVVVQPCGADEAVIVDAHGCIVEGAYSGLLWWRGATLVQPDEALARIPSVTVSLVLEAARAAGVPVASERITPAGLADCEVWVLSALHGLRTAISWVDGPSLAAPTRAEDGRRWLASTERPLPTP